MDHDEFIDKYQKLVYRAWTSEDYTATLLSDPKEALRDAGLSVGATATVTVKRQTEGEPDIEAQVRLWDEGASSGNYVLYVPETPAIDLAELSEGDLEGVAAGLTSACCCCSCTPCCSCTL